MNQAITHLIDYQPYRFRNECCAIGLLSLLPDGQVKAHLAKSLRKVKAMHPVVDLDELRHSIDELARGIQDDPASLRLYIEPGVGPIRIAKKTGLIRYASQEEYDQGIAWSLSQAAEPSARQEARERPPVSRLFVEMKSMFSSMGWLAKMGNGIKDHKILPRYVISADEGVGVDFALLNTSMHYIQTANMRTVGNATQKRHEVQSKWFSLGIAEAVTPSDIRGAGIKGYAVIAGSDTEEGAKAVKAAHRVANAGVFVHESSEDMDELLEIIAKAMDQSLPPKPLAINRGHEASLVRSKLHKYTS